MMASDFSVNSLSQSRGAQRQICSIASATRSMVGIGLQGGRVGGRNRVCG